MEKKKKAMVIDNESQILELLEFILERAGYSVETYALPLMCPLYNRDCECDVLIMSYRMPQINGIEFIRHLHKEKRNVDKIALMFAFWRTEEAREAEGLCRVFFKPFDINEFEYWI